MKKIFYLFILTFIISSCKQECKESTQSVKTTYKPDVISIIPYKGNEKLKFIHNDIDTITFYGQGIKTEYQYTTTQDDCPSKIPLENKYLVFFDSIFNYSFITQVYVNYLGSSNCLIKTNNKTMYNGDAYYFTNLFPPFTSLEINNTKYDSLTYYEKGADYFYYKINTKGMLKFKSGNDVFELIP
jgi:hypothetical protein